MRILVTTDRRQGGGLADSVRVRPIRSEAWLKESVIQALRRAGAVPLLLPPGEAHLGLALEGISAVCITGGDFDIHPRHFGHEPIEQLGRVDELRTNTELALARLCLDKDIPVLGLCGGMQALAVACGGTLLQDLDTQLIGVGEHQQPTDPAEGWHQVELTGQLRNLLGSRPVVNSTHHQAVLDPGSMRIAGTAPDGVIEAVELPAHAFCVGVQWHPELLAGSAPLFQALVTAASR
jgi:putative glutamine amidotransferase